jgi:adenylate cyclase
VSTEAIVDIGADPLDSQRRRRRALMRVGVPFAGVALIAAVILGIALYDYEANRAGALALSDKMLQNLEARISLEVASYLDPAVRATELVREMATNGVFGTERGVAERLAMTALAKTPQIDAFDFADSNGNFMMVRRGAAGGIDTKLIDNAPGARQVMWIRRNAAGEEVAREFDPTDDYDPRSRSWYTGALKAEGMFWTDPYVFFTGQVLGITAAISYHGPRGNPYVFGVDISLQAISDFLASLKIGVHGRAALIDDSGTLVAMPDIRGVLRSKDGQLVPARIDEIGDVELAAAYDRYRIEGYGRRIIRVGGERIVSIVAPVPAAQRNWKMLIVVPEADFTGFLARDSRTTLALSLGVIAVAAALAALLVRQGLRTDRAARLLLDRSHAIGRQSAAFTALAANADLFDPKQRAPPHALTELLADVASARRASLWRLEHGTLRCEDSYDRDSEGHVAGMELSQAEAPKFFSSLATGEAIELAEVVHDPRVVELHRIMLQQLGTRVLTVLPVRSAGQVTGALWIEDPQSGATAHDFLRVIAGLMAIRMPAAGDAPSSREAAPARTAVGAEPGERSFSDALALRGIDATTAEVYPAVAVMVVKFGDPVAMASRSSDAEPMLADTIACTLQRLATEHAIPYLKMTGSAIVAAAGWGSVDATATDRIADTALAVRESCTRVFEDAGLSPSFRIGLDCGIAIGSAVGEEPRLFNLWGEAVTTADIMAQSVTPGVIQATEPVHRRLARDFLFRPRGSFYVPRIGTVQTFILASRL